MPIVAAQRTGYFITCSCSAHKDSPWARWNMIIQIYPACTHACTQICTDTQRDSLRDSLSRALLCFCSSRSLPPIPTQSSFQAALLSLTPLKKKHFLLFNSTNTSAAKIREPGTKNPTRSYGEQGSFLRGGSDVSECKAIKGRNVITKWNTGTRDPGWKH